MQNHEIPCTTATWGNVEDAAFSANLNDKRILAFYLKIQNMQNHEIPYTTATWGSVEHDLEPAPFLWVAVSCHTKMDACFCVDRATNISKKHKNNNFVIYAKVRRHWTACQLLRWRLPGCVSQR